LNRFAAEQRELLKIFSSDFCGDKIVEHRESNPVQSLSKYGKYGQLTSRGSSVMSKRAGAVLFNHRASLNRPGELGQYLHQQTVFYFC
jgi:hypothetical protein